jgi:hypothetical protein
MVDIINSHHKLAAKIVVSRGDLYYPPVTPITCKDGFTMSVQASKFAYSSPRETAAWPYSAFEVGFPNRVEPLLMPYAEMNETPTETVYGWVPLSVLLAVVKKHGGIIVICENAGSRYGSHSGVTDVRRAITAAEALQINFPYGMRMRPTR